MKTEEMIEVMQAFVDGKAIELCRKHFTDWGDVSEPLWDWCCYDYRIKPKVIKKLVLPWDFIEKKFIYAAMDEDGDVYIYEEEPKKESFYWHCDRSMGDHEMIGRGIIIDTDGVEWEESLTERP